MYGVAELVDIVVQQLPVDLIWTHVLGVLIGQADGKVFVPERAVIALDRFEMVIERDDRRYGWNVWLRPAHRDEEASS